MENNTQFRFYTYSFGCRVNQAEKEEIDKQLIKKGGVVSESNPDIYVINTCSVTHKAEREVRQHINLIRKKFPVVKIIVTGCAATNWIKLAKKPDLKIDLLVDNIRKEYLVDLIAKKFIKPNIKRTTHKPRLDQPSDKYISSRRIILKIQDGCHRFCSFCIVPYLRGLPKSVPIKEIIKKVRKLESTINEIIISAINTEAYGYDTKETFIDLIKAVLKKTKIRRISFGSIHPWTINEDFIRFYKNYSFNNRLVHFFHIPLQSGSNKILNLMKRGYNKEQWMEKLNSLYKLNPSILLGTDIIVGFLDETEKDFYQTYRFLEQSPIVKFHVFRFSIRQHTAAYYMSKTIKTPSFSIVKKRASALRQLGEKKYYQFLEKHLGKTLEVMFLKSFKNGLQKGLLPNQLPVYVKSNKDFTGRFKPVKIQEIKNNLLIGKLVGTRY